MSSDQVTCPTHFATSLLRPHYYLPLDTMLGWGSAQETWFVALVCRCVCFCCSVCLAGNFTLPLKYKVQLSCKIELGSSLWSFPNSRFETDTAQQSNFCGNVQYTQSCHNLFQSSKWEWSNGFCFNSNNSKCSVLYCLKIIMVIVL